MSSICTLYEGNMYDAVGGDEDYRDREPERDEDDDNTQEEDNDSEDDG